jgi:hypothetical protein
MSCFRYLVALLILIPIAGLASNPTADLQAKIDKGTAKLEWVQGSGYLRSVLKQLNIPVSSQALVFSKTSLQSDRISPKTPRAIYFNDDTYVAWVQGASLLEIMSVDPKTGSAFYVLNQEPDGHPLFERSTGHECSVCHFVQQAAPKFVPRLMFTSVIPDTTGDPGGAFPIDTTDRSPMSERWGGWYVTGTHGTQKHLGNIVLPRPSTAFAKIPPAEMDKGANLLDLSTRFDTKPYLSPNSDIVALMVLAHQVEVQNLIALASGKPNATPKDVGEPLLKAMLFSGAVPLTSPIRGSSTFAADFAALGPKDKQGRCLREFDLKTRLFRYPLSYLIYSKPFDAMPDGVRAYVYQRLKDVLNGTDKTPAFAHISASDRTAILGILKETKPEFANR